MKKCAFLLALAFPSFSLYAEQVEIGSASSTITIDTKTAGDCRVTAVEKYSRFMLYQYDVVAHKYYLVQQDFERGTGCFEGSNPAKIQVIARDVDVSTGKMNEDSAWSFTAEGEEGKQAGYNFDNLYQVTMAGCCGADTSTLYYSLENGKFVLSTTIDPIKIAIANTDKHAYIGVESNVAQLRMGDEKSLATVFYANNSGLLQKISVYEKIAKQTICRVTALKFVDAKQNNQTLDLFNKENFKGVEVQVELTCDKIANPVSVTFAMLENSLDVKSANITGVDVNDIMLRASE